MDWSAKVCFWKIIYILEFIFYFPAWPAWPYLVDWSATFFLDWSETCLRFIFLFCIKLLLSFILMYWLFKSFMLFMYILTFCKLFKCVLKSLLNSRKHSKNQRKKCFKRCYISNWESFKKSILNLYNCFIY